MINICFYPQPPDIQNYKKTILLIIARQFSSEHLWFRFHCICIKITRDNFFLTLLFWEAFDHKTFQYKYAPLKGRWPRFHPVKKVSKQGLNYDGSKSETIKIQNFNPHSVSIKLSQVFLQLSSPLEFQLPPDSNKHRMLSSGI